MAETKTPEKDKEKSEPKNIYAKMAAVKSKLLGIKKGGKNDFSHYAYFELGDILPVLTPALEEERLYMKTQFSATEQVAKLIIFDIDLPESQIDFEIRFAECALKGAHEIQCLGAAQTYTRRYLIMTAFDIAESDIVDAGAERDEKKEAAKPKVTPPAQRPLAPAPKNQQPADKTLDLTRRQAWELIKKLPQEEQAKWIDSCKGADLKILEEIIAGVTAELNAPPKKAAPESQPPQKKSQGEALADEAAGDQSLEKMKAEFFALVERLPEDMQNDWLAAGDSDGNFSDLISRLKEEVAYIDGGAIPQQAGINPQELEIY